MARAETTTLLPLDRFAKIMGAHPLHFNGVYHESLAPATTCGQPLMQYDWQTADGIGREAIASAIRDAEELFAGYLGFKPLPTFEVDERHVFPRTRAPELLPAFFAGPAGMASAVKLNYGHVVAGGVRSVQLLAANAPIVYTDEDQDGYYETATASAATSSTDVNEIAAFFAGENADPQWEIRPIEVAISGGVATVTMRREQLTIPSLWESLDRRAIDGAEDGNFVSVVDIYRVYHDPSQQAQFLWENQPTTCGCSTSTCAMCYLSAQFGCTVVRDYRLGLISGQYATWNYTTLQYDAVACPMSRAPDSARFWYRAGYRDQTRKRPMHEMSPRWERAIGALAATLLDRPFCSCRNVENISSYWREDLAANTQAGSNRLSNKWLDNPLGTTRGAVHAWRIIRNEALGDSV